MLAWDAARGWELAASGIVAAAGQSDSAADVSVRLDNAESAPKRDVTAWSDDEARDFYAHCASRGLDYGPAFQGLRGVALDGESAIGIVALRDEVQPGPASASELHPALLDAAFQTIGALLRDQRAFDGLVPLPRKIDELDLVGTPSGELLVEARLRPGTAAGMLVADLSLANRHDGSLVARVAGLELTLTVSQAARPVG